MQVTAIAKNIKISPQKARLVVAQIKKMKPQQAVAMLDFVNKKSAIPLKKVIASAIANSVHNSGLNQDSLMFKSIEVSGGRVLKRFRPVSRGRAHSILKRTSHIKVVLEAGENKTNMSNKSNTSIMSQKKESEGGGRGPKS